jgi:transposase
VYTVALRDEIRTWVLVQGKSQRTAARHFGISRNTVAKLLEEAPHPLQRRYHRQMPHPTPVRDVVVPHLEGWIKENEWLQRWAPKQRWTAHRMWAELQSLGIGVAESTVRHLVRELQPASRPAYVPLDFAPGERAEFDFGEALIQFQGQLRKVPFLAGRLRFSGAMFVEGFPTQRQDAFLLGQQQAFAFWGGVPRMAVYDNLKAAVTQVLEGHRRQQHEAFRHFQSVYRFEALFANVHAGWETGSVENLVGYVRRNYLVPVPEVESWDALNATLRERCLADQQRIMAGRTDSIASRLELERAYLGPLPEPTPTFGPLREVLVRSTGRVRFETNEYSVPIQYAYQRLTLQADPFRVRLLAGETVVAEHPRSYGQRQVVEDWRHYVPLLLEKPFAVPWASALRHGDLPPQWETARQELAARRPDGNREFARLLALALEYPLAAVDAALSQARAQGGWSSDTVRHLLGWAQDQSPTAGSLDPVRYPQYQVPQPQPNLEVYNRLLEVGS